jgi:hypothetical protein
MTDGQTIMRTRRAPLVLAQVNIKQKNHWAVAETVPLLINESGTGNAAKRLVPQRALSPASRTKIDVLKKLRCLGFRMFDFEKMNGNRAALPAQGAGDLNRAHSLLGASIYLR